VTSDATLTRRRGPRSGASWPTLRELVGRAALVVIWMIAETLVLIDRALAIRRTEAPRWA
jgi:hypothetical protein